MKPKSSNAETIAVLRPVVELVWRTSPRFFIVTVSASLLAGLLPLATISIAAKMLAFMAQAAHAAVPDPTTQDRLVTILGLMAGVAILKAILTEIEDTTERLYRTKTSNHVQGLISAAAAQIDSAAFEGTELRAKVRDLSADTSGRPFALFQHLLSVVSSLTTIVALSAIVVWWHFWLLPFLLLPSLVLFWLTSRLGVRTEEMKQKRAELGRRAGYLKGVLTSERASAEVRWLQLKDYFLDGLRGVWGQIYEEDRRLALRSLPARLALGAVLSLHQPLLLGYVVSQLLLHQIVFWQFSLYMLSFSHLQNRLKGVAVALGQIRDGRQAIYSLTEFLALPGAASGPTPGPLVGEFSRSPRIEFRNVSVRAPNTEKYLLKNVSFTIPAGAMAGFVGIKGLGKSAMVKLLTGLSTPEAGEILLDGIDVKTIDRVELQRQFGVALHDSQIYQLSVAENIGLGDVGRISDRAAVEAAVRWAGLEEAVKALPQGCDTVLTKHEQRDFELGAEARYQVALARLYFRGAPNWMIDDPISDMDPVRERHILDRLTGSQSARAGALLMFCHRLSAARHMDKIFLFVDASLVEEGTHEHLMANRGRYAEMFHRHQRASLGPREERLQARGAWR